MLVTDNFFEDPFCLMMQDELIMTTICNGDEQWKVIPVYPTRPVNKIPLGIRAINAISLSRIIYRGSMASTLPILTQDNTRQFDRFFAKYLQNLYASKQVLRIRREEADLRKLELWLSQEREKMGWDAEDTSFNFFRVVDYNGGATCAESQGPLVKYRLEPQDFVRRLPVCIGTINTGGSMPICHASVW